MQTMMTSLIISTRTLHCNALYCHIWLKLKIFFFRLIYTAPFEGYWVLSVSMTRCHTHNLEMYPFWARMTFIFKNILQFPECIQRLYPFSFCYRLLLWKYLSLTSIGSQLIMVILSPQNFQPQYFCRFLEFEFFADLNII